jgi:ferrochelatase
MRGRKSILNQSKTAVLLVNFGGPDSLRSVKPFLYNLFSDSKIIGLPAPLRQFLAWIISTSREKASGEMYKKIGSKSPLIPITYLQSQKLQQLFRKNKIDIDVFLGFRYCKPYIEDSLDLIKSKGYEKIVVLSLYPQYSFTTTGSTEMVVENWKKKNNVQRQPVIFSIKDWYKDEDYIQSYANQINNALENLDLRSTEILFSAHSIPIKNILNGDPYEKHINETAKLIIEKLKWKKKWHIAYQSKLGPVKWLEPSCEVVIEEIAKRNQNASILVVPISFVCEHVETIYEIGMLYKEFARKAGIKTFRRVPALNTDKFLIQALYNQVLNALESNKINIKELLITYK